MDVTFIQTADPINYRAMLEITSRTVIEHCRRKGFQYESYIGVKRGYWPWQATYNRIHQLKEILDRGYRGWVVYLDADAYVVDLDFDLAAYLAERSDKAAVLMPSMATDHHWDINAGVVLLNFDHPLGREIAWLWADKFEKLSDERLREAEQWLDADSDQDMIQIILRERPDIADAVYLQSTDLMNASFATYIRQHLRSYTASFDERVESIRREVTDVLRAVEENQIRLGDHDAVINAAYRGVFGRGSDPYGKEDALNTLRHLGVENGLAQLISSFIASDEYRDRVRDQQLLDQYRQIPATRRQSLLAEMGNIAVPEDYTGYFIDPNKPAAERRRETLYELDGLVNAQSIGFTVELIPYLYPFLETMKGRGRHLEALDVGSRTGAGASLIADLFMTYHSHCATWVDTLDIDPTFREYQQSRWPHIRSAISGDVFELPSASYDYVICSHTIEHIPDPVPFCRQLQRIARDHVFLYCPYDEQNPIPGHHTVDDGVLDALGAENRKIFKSWWWRPVGEMADVVLFTLPGGLS